MYLWSKSARLRRKYVKCSAWYKPNLYTASIFSRDESVPALDPYLVVKMYLVYFVSQDPIVSYENMNLRNPMYFYWKKCRLHARHTQCVLFSLTQGLLVKRLTRYLITWRYVHYTHTLTCSRAFRLPMRDRK